MRRLKILVSVLAVAMASFGIWLLWAAKPPAVSRNEAMVDTNASTIQVAGVSRPAGGASDPVSTRLGKPADIPGEVAYESVDQQYPRAFSMTMTIGPPEGPALDAFRVAEAALNNGNAHAGFTMFMAIKRCQEEQMAVRMRDLKNAENDPVEYQRLLVENEATLRECEGVGPAEIARGYDGLKQAAERGDISAQLYYPAVGAAQFSSSTTEMLRSAEKIVQFRADSLRFINAALDRGSLDAIQELAATYKHGILVQRDLQKSYVYAYALYLLQPKLFSQMSIDSAAESLTEEQVLAARQQARLVLDRCCK